MDKTLFKGSKLPYFVLDFIYNSEFKEMIFYGGSCLRILYDLPRMSEDLDFEALESTDFQKLALGLEKYFRENLKLEEKFSVVKQKNINRIFLNLPLMHRLGLSAHEKENAINKINFMPKIIFDYNLGKDAWSWVLIAKKKDCWGKNWQDQVAHIPSDLLQEILSLNFFLAQKKVERYLKKRLDAKYRDLMIKQTWQGLASVWKTVEKDFFQILAKMTQRPIYAKNFGCFLTTGFMCPYNEEKDWFMVSWWHSIPHSITTICHEIFHLQFLHYYRGYLTKRGLKKAQLEDLKEALTFLLNEPEFEKIILSYDCGYPRHQKLRKGLKKIWDKEKDFEKFLEEAAGLLRD